MVRNKASLRSGSTLTPWLIWLVAVSFYAYEFTQRVSISVILPDLLHDFHATAASIGFMSAAYYYAYAIMQIPAGLLVDRFGPKPLATLGVLLVSLGALGISHMHSIAIGGLWRFFIGAGSAFAFVCTMKFIILWFPRGRFALMTGLTNFSGYFGAVLGEMPLQTYAHKFGWRTTIFITALIGLVITFLTLFIVRAKPYSQKRLRHKRVKVPDIFHGLNNVMRNTQNWLNGIFCGLMVGPTSAFAALWGLSFLTRVDHLSHGIAASILATIFTGVAIGSPIFGWLADFFKRRQCFLIIGASGSLLATLILLFGNHLPVPILFVMAFLFGFCQSSHALNFVNAKEANHRHSAGTAIAFTNMALIIGGALLQPAIGIVLDVLRHGAILHGTATFSPHIFHIALLLIPLSQIIALCIALFGLQDKKQRHA